MRALMTAAARERRAKLNAINPEIPPHAMLGDVGFVVPELEKLEADVLSWGLRIALIGFAVTAGIVIGLTLIAIATLWFIGAI